MDETQDILDRYGISPPQCGADAPTGWLPLLERLIVDLLVLGWDRDCQQIKVKFGGLRFYVGAASEECRTRIDAAEGEAESTCTVCGAPSSTETLGRYSARCESHREP